MVASVYMHIQFISVLQTISYTSTNNVLAIFLILIYFSDISQDGGWQLPSSSVRETIS